MLILGGLSMIYCFDQGLKNADGTFKYTKYDAEYFRNEGSEVTFVFIPLLSTIDMEQIYRNLKIKNETIIGLYTGFTGNTITPISYTVDDLINSFEDKNYRDMELDYSHRFSFYNDSYLDAYYSDESKRFIKEAHLYSKGHLTRKDFYSHGLIFSEFYRQKDTKDCLYSRRFYSPNRNSSYDEIITNNNSKYIFDETIIESQKALIGLMLEQLHIKKEDTVILDYDHECLQEILLYSNSANLLMTRSSSAMDMMNERFNF